MGSEGERRGLAVVQAIGAPIIGVKPVGIENYGHFGALDYGVDKIFGLGMRGQTRSDTDDGFFCGEAAVV